MKRLFEIMYLLSEKKCIKASELAEHFEVSVRTIYRDVETLSMAGIPIYAKKGKYGGIAILDNLLVKLSGLFQIKNPNWISIGFSDWSNQHQELFQRVKFAIVKTRVLKFDYYGRIGYISTRKVEPIQLWFKGHAWYLGGYCQEKQAIRVFKLSRMKRVECLDESFEKKKLNIEDKEEIDKYIDSPQNKISFSMKIDKCMAYQVFDYFEEHEIKSNEDGSFTVSLNYPKDEWLYGMIMSFGNHAKVISPESLKSEVANRFKEAYENYF